MGGSAELALLVGSRCLGSVGGDKTGADELGLVFALGDTSNDPERSGFAHVSLQACEHSLAATGVSCLCCPFYVGHVDDDVDYMGVVVLLLFVNIMMKEEVAPPPPHVLQ